MAKYFAEKFAHNVARYLREIPFVIAKLILRKPLKFHRQKIKRAKTFITQGEWHDDIANLPVFINKQRIKIPSKNSIVFAKTNCFSSPWMTRAKTFEISQDFVSAKAMPLALPFRLNLNIKYYTELKYGARFSKIFCCLLKLQSNALKCFVLLENFVPLDFP